MGTVSNAPHGTILSTQKGVPFIWENVYKSDRKQHLRGNY